MKKQVVVIIGAGPSGLTAAYELAKENKYDIYIYEQTHEVGGIARTVNYKGNRIDIGGHRFFSKSDRIMQWWLNVFPLQSAPARDDRLLGRNVTTSPDETGRDPEIDDVVMLRRRRLSRIYFMRKFFDYPIRFSKTTLFNLGIKRIILIALSYMKICLFPIRKEKSLRDFFINRFGQELYELFFEDYTQKVWGIPCGEISPEWGAQRVKGLSISKTIEHAVKKFLAPEKDITQKNIETSLIEEFMYPKLGPGQLWEEVLKIAQTKGVQVFFDHEVAGFDLRGGQIKSVRIHDKATGKEFHKDADFVLSTMPIKDLVAGLNGDVPSSVRTLAEGLVYRDFITVGLLLRNMRIKNTTEWKTINNIIPDNWIYIQERDVRMGRIQIFNNWSPYLIKDPDTIWVGLEYFCSEGDPIWNRPDEELTDLATAELEKIEFIEKEDVLDSIVIRSPKTYPAYFGTYPQFDTIRTFTDTISNLFLIGRNGMHRYNNMDHSMLSAMEAVNNINNGIKTKDNIWAVNAEKEYHEHK